MRKKRDKLLLKFSILHVFILMGLFLMGPFSFAQISQPIQQNPSAQENPQGENAGFEEDHDTKKLDKVLQEYNKDQKKVQQDAEMIKEMETTGELSDEELGRGKVLDPDNEKSLQDSHDLLGPAMAKLNHGNRKDLKNIKYSDAIRITLQPLQKLSEKELADLLVESTKGTSAGVYVEKFPHLMMISVRLIKDPEAIPSMVRIVDDHDKLIRFMGLMVATILVGFFLRKFMHKEGRGVFAALGLWTLRFFIMWALRLAIIIAFYSDELSPAFKIISRDLF